MNEFESGMPDKWQWDKFFHPVKVIGLFGCASEAGDVVKCNCGNGTFTLQAGCHVAWERARI